ncbi:MAG: hypothetical protein ACYTAF_12990, partial [Planctomycetota bacterium]
MLNDLIATLPQPEPMLSMAMSTMEKKFGVKVKKKFLPPGESPKGGPEENALDVLKKDKLQRKVAEDAAIKAEKEEEAVAEKHGVSIEKAKDMIKKGEHKPKPHPDDPKAKKKDPSKPDKPKEDKPEVKEAKQLKEISKMMDMPPDKRAEAFKAYGEKQKPKLNEEQLRSIYKEKVNNKDTVAALKGYEDKIKAATATKGGEAALGEIARNTGVPVHILKEYQK